MQGLYLPEAPLRNFARVSIELVYISFLQVVMFNWH